MGDNSPITLRAFERLVKSYHCSIHKTTKEWEVIDDVDGLRVSGFATISGRMIKKPYVKLFEKTILAKRNRV